jgi:sugar O-acyltransferase (sialic acid O-acetyltransferase NeuD family)
MSDLFGIYGASGFGREVMPLARALAEKYGFPSSSVVFIDDACSEDTINGHAVLTYQDFCAASAGKKHVVVAIADALVRKKLYEKCAGDGIYAWSVVAENSVVMDCVELGDGAVISPFVTLTSNIKIGVGFHANIYSYVAHDCVIGDYVTFAPGVKCNGNVIIEDGAYVGTGAVIRQGSPGKPLVIGSSAVVGMGAVVTKSVASGVTVVGNPARPLTKDGLKK